MQVGLKKISVSKANSQETTCFSAEITVDGKVIGTARNSGSGGSNDYYWKDKKAGAALEAYAETQVFEFEFGKLDQLIDKLVGDHEENKLLKRLCKKQTVFRLTRSKPGEWLCQNQPFNDTVKQLLRREFGDTLVEIANERFT